MYAHVLVCVFPGALWWDWWCLYTGNVVLKRLVSHCLISSLHIPTHTPSCFAHWSTLHPPTSHYTALHPISHDFRVLALNYVGGAGPCLPYIADLLRAPLPHVRVFQDTNDDTALKNYVFFASRRPLTAAAPTAEDVGNDAARAQYFSLLASYEVTELLPGWAGGGSHARCLGQAGMWDLAQAHWMAMAASFPPGFWAYITY